MKAFADLADLPENVRIDIIRETAAAGNIVAVCVDDDGNAADRYARKLGATVRLIDRGPGPVKGTILLRVGPRES